MKPCRPLILLVFLALPLHADEPKTIKLTLSPETTYLMEPQLPDGRIDYFAALNERLAARTTPENNLLVGIFSLLLGETEEALLREQETEEEKKNGERLRNFRERFCKMIGLDTPPPLDALVASSPISLSKDYEKELLEFYSREELASMIETQREKEKKHRQGRFDNGGMTKEEYDAEIKKIETEISPRYYRAIVDDQWNETRRRPWTAEEFPCLAKWMTATDEWTPKLIALSRQRTGYYHPLLSYDGNLFLLYNALLPYAQSLRSATRFLEMRGNWEFAQGNIDQAMECTFSSIRMGQTMRKGAGWIVEDLIGVALTGVGNYQLTTYLADLPKDKDAAWILKKKKEYDTIETAIGPLPSPPTWCFHERVSNLSAVQFIAVNPKTAREWFKSCGFSEEVLAKYEKIFSSATEYDWDEILKQVNLFYDDLEDIFLIPSWQRRYPAAERFEKRIAEYSQRSVDSSDGPERRATDFLLGNLAPATAPIAIAFTRSEWDRRITSVAFALAAHRADNGGESPDSLEQLVPKYLDSVPDSPFTDKPLRYLKRKNDVLIANDDAYKLDGSEPEVEKLIAEERSGGRVFPAARHFIFIAVKK